MQQGKRSKQTQGDGKKNQDKRLGVALIDGAEHEQAQSLSRHCIEHRRHACVYRRRDRIEGADEYNNIISRRA